MWREFAKIRRLAAIVENDTTNQFARPCQNIAARKSQSPNYPKENSATQPGTGTVLLQTARATAFNEENSNSTEVRILFYNGSQRSYVTSNLMSRLNLKPVKTETLHLITFDGNSFRKQSCDVIKLRLKGQDGDYLRRSK